MKKLTDGMQQEAVTINRWKVPGLGRVLLYVCASALRLLVRFEPSPNFFFLDLIHFWERRGRLVYAAFQVVVVGSCLTRNRADDMEAKHRRLQNQKWLSNCGNLLLDSRCLVVE